MAKVKTTQRFIVEDFPDQKDWIGKLFYIMNKFLTEVVYAINGNILFKENITGQEQLLDFNYVSNAVSFPLQFKWNLTLPPLALYVVYAVEGSSTASDVAVMIQLAWQYTADGNIQITDAVKLTSAPSVINLVNGKRYKIRVRVTP